MADMIATIGRPPIVVTFGENSAEAMRQAALANQSEIDAEAFADAASGSADLAALAALTAPYVYATKAAGLAAVSDGQTFWSNEDHPLALYRDVAGVATLQAQLVTTHNPELSGDLSLLDADSVITKGGDRFIHNFDPEIVVAGQAGHSTFVGVNAGNLTNSSVWNTALGEGALTSITAAHLNTAVGARALTNNTTGQTNTAVGADAMVTNTTGGYNNAFGTKALRNNTTGGYNCAFGQSSMFWSNTGSNNSGFGNDTLAENASGDLNTAVGSRALNANVSGNHNTAVGAQSLLTALSTSDNNAFGFQALYRSTSGVQLCAFGSYALNYNTTGSYNVAFGNSALLLNTTGSYNVAFGYQSMQSNTAGGSNVAIGSQALYSNLTAGGSVAIGETTLYGSTGTGMVGIGLGAGYGVGGNESSTVDTYCTFIGRHATRDSSVATATPITNSTCIGADAKVTKSHQVVIGASTVTETVLRGVQRGTTYTVNALPVGAVGDRAFVTDATATTFASIAAGGGSNNVPVYHNGTNWCVG